MITLTFIYSPLPQLVSHLVPFREPNRSISPLRRTVRLQDPLPLDRGHPLRRPHFEPKSLCQTFPPFTLLQPDSVSALRMETFAKAMPRSLELDGERLPASTACSGTGMGTMMAVSLPSRLCRRILMEPLSRCRRALVPVVGAV